MIIEVCLTWVYLILPSFCSTIPEWDSSVNRPRFQSFETVRDDHALYLLGGSETRPHNYPFQTALDIFKDADKKFCGGSLISNRWVLTAAHCVIMEPDYILVTLGAYHFPEVSPDVVMKSTHYIAHEGWDKSTFENDVGLIKLPQKVTFDKFIKPVQLASGIDKHVGQEAIAIGWGVTETQVSASVLMEILTNIIPNDQCANSTWVFRKMIKPTHICTSGEGFTSTCHGDSGGPLLINDKQVGIVSFGVRDCSKNMPSVFTRVSDFSEWISARTVDTDTDTDPDADTDQVDVWMVVVAFVGLLSILLMVVIIVQNCLILKSHSIRYNMKSEESALFHSVR